MGKNLNRGGNGCKSHRIPEILKQLSEPTCPFSNAHSWETYPKTPMFLGEPYFHPPYKWRGRKYIFMKMAVWPIKDRSQSRILWNTNLRQFPLKYYHQFITKHLDLLIIWNSILLSKQSMCCWWGAQGVGNSPFLHLWGWGGNRLPCKKKGVSFGGGGNGGGDGGWGVRCGVLVWGK